MKKRVLRPWVWNTINAFALIITTILLVWITSIMFEGFFGFGLIDLANAIVCYIFTGSF